MRHEPITYVVEGAYRSRENDQVTKKYYKKQFRLDRERRDALGIIIKRLLEPALKKEDPTYAGLRTHEITHIFCETKPHWKPMSLKNMDRDALLDYADSHDILISDEDLLILNSTESLREAIEAAEIDRIHNNPEGYTNYELYLRIQRERSQGAEMSAEELSYLSELNRPDYKPEPQTKPKRQSSSPQSKKKQTTPAQTDGLIDDTSVNKELEYLSPNAEI